MLDGAQSAPHIPIDVERLAAICFHLVSTKCWPNWSRRTLGKRGDIVHLNRFVREGDGEFCQCI